MLWGPWRLIFCRGQVLKSAYTLEMVRSHMPLKGPSRLHALGNAVRPVWKLLRQFLVFQQ